MKVSRPGLWFATIWLYLLPTSGQPELFNTIPFWLGLFYVSFPLNFLVYSWNDSVDIETDAINPRKDSFWFGARGTNEQLKDLWKPNLIIQGIMIPIVAYCAGIQSLLIFAVFLLVNYLYNLPKNGLRTRPPLELACQLGYLLIVPLIIQINQLESISFFAYLYLFLFAVQSHLMGEVMDIKPDKAAKRRTTATDLGVVRTKILIILIVIAELIILYFSFNEYIFTAILGFGLVWLLIDLLIIFKNRTYTLSQMRLFGLASNLIALASIIYVWQSGCLI